MSRFLDQYLPAEVPGYPCVGTPRFSTTLQVAASGAERANQDWETELNKFVLPEAVARQWPVVLSLKNHFRAMRGPNRVFPFRDPFDFASVELLVPNEPETDVLARVACTDQSLGTGDGAARTFQLAKSYVLGGDTYVRTVAHPVLSTLLIGDAGAPVASGFSADRVTGAVTFDVAPTAGHALTWGGLFDLEVRYEADDTLEAIVRAYQAGGFGTLTLVETRPC